MRIIFKTIVLFLRHHFGIKTNGGYLFFLLVFNVLPGYSQNISGFSIEDQSIKQVKFDAKQISKIKVENSKSFIFEFTSSSESTYKNDLYFDYYVENETLFITDIYPEHLEYGDSKMTSTQVFSVEVNLKIPKNTDLNINSKYASVFINGNYGNIIVNTKSGICTLNISEANATINTYTGNISVITQDAIVKAESQNGKIHVDRFVVRKNWLNLKSIDGDITVKKARID